MDQCQGARLQSVPPDGVTEGEGAAPAATEHEPGVDGQVLPQGLDVTDLHTRQPLL